MILITKLAPILPALTINYAYKLAILVGHLVEYSIALGMCLHHVIAVLMCYLSTVLIDLHHLFDL